MLGELEQDDIDAAGRGSGLRIDATPLPVASRPERRARARATAEAIARHLAKPGLLAAGRRPGAAVAVAKGVRAVFDDLGATYLKLGQLIGSAPSLFGDDVAMVFRGCLDEGPPIPFAEVKAAVEAEFGAPLDELFSSFERTPIAAASIAAVHKATMPDGREVAVKVLRPGIESVVAADVAVMKPLFDFVGAQIAVGIAGTLSGVLDGLELQMEEELDLRNEARAIGWFGTVLATMGITRARVPAVIPERSGRRVLTTEFLKGRSIDRLLDPANPPPELRPALIDALQAWFAATLTSGVFHGDIHAGNLLMLDDGTLGIVDWGVVGRLEESTRHFFRALIAGCLGDESAWPEVTAHLRAVYGTGLQDTLGLDGDAMLELVKGQVKPIMTTPFAELDLRQMLIGTEQSRERGPELEGTGLRTKLTKRYRYWQEQRRLQQTFRNSPGRRSSFDRDTFLLSKQLVYLERYGKLYLPDVPLLYDRDAFAAMLAAAPA
ncbi:MAG: hypothetical protein QOF60_1686 [Actinomycetota bacterium]|jgi:predicted unusual protein kinase regulating ubiquinone biosynthesis (AarF/ABC1/UbiB family)|nr:hypothetical protein [Actinomycetota bacterium]